MDIIQEANKFSLLIDQRQKQKRIGSRYKTTTTEPQKDFLSIIPRFIINQSDKKTGRVSFSFGLCASDLYLISPFFSKMHIIEVNFFNFLISARQMKFFAYIIISSRILLLLKLASAPNKLFFCSV